MIVISEITCKPGRIAAQTPIAHGEDVLGLTRQASVSVPGGRVALIDLAEEIWCSMTSTPFTEATSRSRRRCRDCSASPDTTRAAPAARIGR